MSFLGFLFGMKKKESFSRNLKLFSMRKVGDKSIFKVEKNQTFLKHFKVLLGNIGFEDIGSWHYDPALNREFPVSKLVNFCDTFKSKAYEIDVIFTQDREVIIVKTSEAGRTKFVEELMKFCSWFETKRKIQPLKQNF